MRSTAAECGLVRFRLEEPPSLEVWRTPVGPSQASWASWGPTPLAWAWAWAWASFPANRACKDPWMLPIDRTALSPPSETRKVALGTIPSRRIPAPFEQLWRRGHLQSRNCILLCAYTHSIRFQTHCHGRYTTHSLPVGRVPKMLPHHHGFLLSSPMNRWKTENHFGPAAESIFARASALALTCVLSAMKPKSQRLASNFSSAPDSFVEKATDKSLASYAPQTSAQLRSSSYHIPRALAGSPRAPLPSSGQLQAPDDNNRTHIQ